MIQTQSNNKNRETSGHILWAKNLQKYIQEVLQYDELEKRLLFSADAVPFADTDPTDDQVVVAEIPQELTTNQNQTADPVAPQSEMSWELVLVNDNISDNEKLISDLQQQNGHRIFEIITLDSHKSGIDQVSNILSERSNIGAMHIVSHADDGFFALGSDWLDNNALLSNSETLSTWSNSLNADADILIYGCNLAESEVGQNLINTLSELTQTDVAASDDLTGHENLGGDWELEYNAGQIETEVVFSTIAQQNFNAVLAETVYESNVNVNESHEVKSEYSLGTDVRSHQRQWQL